MSTKVPKIALGVWSWGAGAAGGDQVVGNYLFEEELKPAFLITAKRTVLHSTLI